MQQIRSEAVRELVRAIELARDEHVAWRRSLLEGDLAPEMAMETAENNRCTVGLWLDRLEHTTRSTLHYETVRSLHRAFHLQVAAFLDVIRSPELADRQWSLVELCSARLLVALEAWRNDIA